MPQSDAKNTRTDEVIRTGLRQIRRSRQWAVASLVLGFLAVVVSGWAFESTAFVTVCIAALWMTAFFYWCRRMINGECPRCGERFLAGSNRWQNPWAQECGHCGLRLDWEPGAGSGQESDRERA